MCFSKAFQFKLILINHFVQTFFPGSVGDLGLDNLENSPSGRCLTFRSNETEGTACAEPCAKECEIQASFAIFNSVASCSWMASQIYSAQVQNPAPIRCCSLTARNLTLENPKSSWLNNLIWNSKRDHEKEHKIVLEAPQLSNVTIIDNNSPMTRKQNQ